MKVIAFIDKKKILAELSPDDLAGIAGFSVYSIDSKLPQNSMHYRDFNPEIVGAEIKPARIFEEATSVISLHKDAMSAADTLKKAASRFCGFFAEETNKAK